MPALEAHKNVARRYTFRRTKRLGAEICFPICKTWGEPIVAKPPLTSCPSCGNAFQAGQQTQPNQFIQLWVNLRRPGPDSQMESAQLSSPSIVAPACRSMRYQSRKKNGLSV